MGTLKPEKPDEPKIQSFEFRILDDTFRNPSTRRKEPLQFLFEDFTLELHDNVRYDAESLPAGININALVHHLNTRPGYPVHSYEDARDPYGRIIPNQKMSIQTGWEKRFECVNITYN